MDDQNRARILFGRCLAGTSLGVWALKFEWLQHVPPVPSAASSVVVVALLWFLIPICLRHSVLTVGAPDFALTTTAGSPQSAHSRPPAAS